MAKLLPSAASFWTFGAPRSLDIVDRRVGIIYRTVQVVVVIMITFSNISGNAFTRIGKGQYFFTLVRDSPPIYGEDALVKSSSWTPDRLFQVQRNSLFIPLSYVDQVEAEGRCHDPTDKKTCLRHDDCRARTHDPEATCSDAHDPFDDSLRSDRANVGGGSLCPSCRCLLKRWCPIGDNKNRKRVSLLEYADKISVRVAARFLPSEQTLGESSAAARVGLFSNYRMEGPNGDQICKSCRLTLKDIIAALAGVAEDVGPSERESMTRAFMEEKINTGLEVQMTYTWHCPEGGGLERYDCGISTSLSALSSSSGFEMPRISQPLPDEQHGQLRRRTIFRGIMIRFQGDGGMESTYWLAVLNMATQIIGFLFLADWLASALAFRVLPGAARRGEAASTSYVESHHKIIAEIVALMKVAEPALDCLPNRVIHAQIEAECRAICSCNEYDAGYDAAFVQTLLALKECSGDMQLFLGKQDMDAKRRLAFIQRQYEREACSPSDDGLKAGEPGEPGEPGKPSEPDKRSEPGERSELSVIILEN
eukprot:gnl/TRDRNA2_/TRDRNA2_196833_c0_seq1.p1 gnl/TRDRNA2_/TRDRNA2_196833_c0~~gnl/TRDRNA2_/TRDRNA2_196833_c0_seq1.p1  ORF type:complete len:536 (-),score=53.17 gnl/TRDRNA2_/TRDRNA2_196833_c0_seq1:33-1640(-)